MAVFDDFKLSIETTPTIKITELTQTIHSLATDALNTIATTLKSSINHRLDEECVDANTLTTLKTILEELLTERVNSTTSSLAEILINEREQYNVYSNCINDPNLLPVDVRNAVEKVRYGEFVRVVKESVKNGEDVFKSTKKRLGGADVRIKTFDKGFAVILKPRLYESMKIAVRRHLLSNDIIEEARRRSLVLMFEGE